MWSVRFIDLLVAPFGRLERFEDERLFMPDRLDPLAAIFPNGRVRELGVVAFRLAFGGLVFRAEMTAAGFVAGERVLAERLGEFHEVRHAAGALDDLVRLARRTRHIDVAPVFAAKRLDS